MCTFETTWHTFNDKLLAYIKTRIDNTYDAEDILQDVFLKVYSNIDQLNDQAAIKSWLYKITNHTIIDFYKKKKDVSIAPERLLEIAVEDDLVDNMNEDISACIRHMMFQLPEKYQSVYDLYERKELKHKEIAETLDISVSNSKVRLKRAKDLFKQKLVKCCDFEVDKYGNIIDYMTKGQDNSNCPC